MGRSVANTVVFDMLRVILACSSKVFWSAPFVLDISPAVRVTVVTPRLSP